MKTSRTRYICWDMDETLGFFRPGKKSEFVKGLPALLEELQGKGVRHVITTASPPLYANLALERTSAGRLFDAIFASDIVCPDNRYKRYAPVAERLGISSHDSVDSMLVIGNADRDSSADLHLVTVIHPDAINYDASVMAAVLGKLMEHRSWWYGFEAMLNLAKPYRDNGIFEGGEISIGDIRLAVGCVGENDFVHSNERLILVVGAGEHRRAKIACMDESVEARVREVEIACTSSSTAV
ncbi:MAG: HAD family hydrolase [Candidatus Micrarchaeota archaeon]